MGEQQAGAYEVWVWDADYAEIVERMRFRLRPFRRNAKEDAREEAEQWAKDRANAAWTDPGASVEVHWLACPK